MSAGARMFPLHDAADARLFPISVQEVSARFLWDSRACWMTLVLCTLSTAIQVVRMQEVSAKISLGSTREELETHAKTRQSQ